MNDKTKQGIFKTICLIGFFWGLLTLPVFWYCGTELDKYRVLRSSTVTDSTLVEEIRRIDSGIEDINQQFRAGIDNVQAGIGEIKGIVESTGNRTDIITAGISRLEKGTGKAIGYSESIVSGFTRIENIVGEMGRTIESEGFDSAGIGADIREQVEILRKELGLLQANNNN